MQRRIGQHHAYIAVLAQMREDLAALFQQHDGPPEGIQELFLFRADEADLFRGRGVAAHDREGLFVALLAPAQRLCDLRIVAAAGQVHAAQALDRDDLSFF